MFGKKKPEVAALPLHEWQDRVDAIVAAGRAARLDARTMADMLEGRAQSLRMAFATMASDAALH